MRGAATSHGLRARIMEVAGDETGRETEAAHCLHHPRGEFVGVSAAQRHRSRWSLRAFGIAIGIAQIFWITCVIASRSPSVRGAAAPVNKPSAQPSTKTSGSGYCSSVRRLKSRISLAEQEKSKLSAPGSSAA